MEEGDPGAAHVRRFRILTVILSFLAALLFVSSLSSSRWVVTNNTREGIFEYCTLTGAATNTTQQNMTCRLVWRKSNGAVAALATLSALFTIFALTLLIVTLTKTHEPDKEEALIRIAASFYALSIFLLVIVLIVKPAASVPRLKKLPGTDTWKIGWCYYFTWGLALYLCAVLGCLLLDIKKYRSEPLYHPAVNDEAEEKLEKSEKELATAGEC